MAIYPTEAQEKLSKDAQHANDKRRVSVKTRPARTLVQVLGHCFYQGYPVTRLRLTPLTGRRHQLRAHMALVLGHPLVGDATYDGGPLAGPLAPRLMLHAKELQVSINCMPLDSSVKISENKKLVLYANTLDPFGKVSPLGQMKPRLQVPLDECKCTLSWEG